MEKWLVKVRERLAKGQYGSESAVREAIILPVLQELGWDIFDPEHVHRECPLGSRRVDYALSASPPRRDVFIEVKAVGLSGGADRQLFEYAFHEGIPLAILTDGQEWNFFLPGEQGNYDERRVQKLNILEREPSEAANLFDRYLSFSHIRSGEALENAKTDYRSVSRRQTAARKIPDAWLALLSEPDSLLLDLITEKAESLCGYRPDAEDVEEFVLNQIAAGPAKSPPEPRSSVRQDHRPQSRTEPPFISKPIAGSGKIEFRVLGQDREARNAIDALVEILRRIADRSPGFMEKLSASVSTRSRNHIARSREAVYPLKPDLAAYTIEVIPGWWLGTNIANREKMRIIRKACEAAGLAFGADISIALPNAA